MLFHRSNMLSRSISVKRIFCWIVIMLFTIDAAAMVLDGSRSNLKYRPARPADLSGIANLLTATFDDEIPDWNVIKLKMTQDGYEKQLRHRMENLVKKGAKHALIVAANDDTKEIVGFMELGTMPSPIPVVTVWEGTEVEIRPEMPYLANVAVSKKCRRQKLGSKLVLLAEKLSTQWCKSDETENAQSALYLAVEKDNAAAIQMYDNLDFDRIIDEAEKFPPKKLKKLNRKPRLYFRKSLSIGEEKSESGNKD